jgi:hypothetical protein
MLAGSAPLDASSGLSTHHRLSRCGDRQHDYDQMATVHRALQVLKV